MASVWRAFYLQTHPSRTAQFQDSRRPAPPRPAQSVLNTPLTRPLPMRRKSRSGARAGHRGLRTGHARLGRGGPGCARRVGSPRPAEAAEERGESVGPRSWTHVPRGLMPRVSLPDAQLAAASATSRHRLPTIPDCRGEELQPLSCSGCAHCPQGPPPGLLRGPGHAP